MIPVILACVLLQTAPAAPISAPTQLQTSSPASSDLLKVKRIYVESFGDDPVSKEMQSLIVSALVASRRFVVTENRERADAVLKGVAVERASQEVHAFGDSTVARNTAISDSSVNTEMVDRAHVAIRLVNPDGDVIWTATQESKGAKYKGASADAADMCVKQLLRDVAKAEAAASAAATPTAPQR